MAGPGKQYVPSEAQLRYRPCSDAISPLVPHWDGHGVSRPSFSQVPVVERAPKGCLRDAFRSQEPFKLSLASRTCILFPQHRVVPVEHLDVDTATILYVPYLYLASRSLTAACIPVFPRQSLRLIKDPVKGVFVPLAVLSFATILIGTINYGMQDHPNHSPPVNRR